MGRARTLVVTGASSGIGAELAKQAVKLGWRVAIGARRRQRIEAVADELRAMGAEVFAGTLDVARSDSVDAFFDSVEAELGPADVIVNNAGHSMPYLMHEYTSEQLRSEVEVNLLGAILVTQRAVKTLLDRRIRGDIVFMSSDAALNPRPGQVIYGATKAGVENFAQGLSKELEGSGVRVVTLRIGPTVSEFGAEWSTDPDDFDERTNRWRWFGLRDARLLGALLSAEVVAEAVIHAVSQPPGVLIDTYEIQPEAPMHAEGQAVLRDEG